MMSFLEVLSFLLIYILIPIAAIVALVFLTIFLYQATQTLKTYDKVGRDLEDKLAILQGPVEVVSGIKSGYDSVISTFSSIGGALFGKKKSGRRTGKGERRYDEED
jgi:hypothetical protein